MSVRLTTEQQAALDEAIEALQVFYEPGDDGDGVRLALNAIAGILGERAGLEVDEDDGLNGVLAELGADADLRAHVAKLYKIAGEGAYGEGLSAKGAAKVNDLAPDLEKPLLALIRKTGRRRK